MQSAPRRSPPDALLADTRDFLTALTRLVYVAAPLSGTEPVVADLGLDDGPPNGRVPAHLSYSGVPAMLNEAWSLLRPESGEGAVAWIAMARWMSDLARLTAAVEALGRAGAVPGPVVADFRALVAASTALVERWGTWARAVE
jgi:hypothetical protein